MGTMSLMFLAAQAAASYAVTPQSPNPWSGDIRGAQLACVRGELTGAACRATDPADGTSATAACVFVRPEGFQADRAQCVVRIVYPGQLDGRAREVVCTYAEGTEGTPRCEFGRVGETGA